VILDQIGQSVATSSDPAETRDLRVGGFVAAGDGLLLPLRKRVPFDIP